MNWQAKLSRQIEAIMSAEIAQIQQRLSSIEADLTHIQRKLGLASTAPNWVEKVSGSLADLPEADYQKFLECCRIVRNGGSISAAEEPTQ